jgi:DNA-binding MarR family transcriptional regulator
MLDYQNTDYMALADRVATYRRGPVTEGEAMAQLPAGSGSGRSQAPELPPSMRDRVPFLLFRASQISLASANRMLTPTGLNARHVGILTMVTELAPMTQKALGEALGIDRTTVVTLLDELASMGYIVRQRHPRDRRAFLVHPTAAGRDAKIEAVRILDEQQRRFLAPLTAAERGQLAALLKRIQGSRDS